MKIIKIIILRAANDNYTPEQQREIEQLIEGLHNEGL